MQAFLNDLVRQSLSAPRDAARAVLALRLGLETLVMLLALATIANTLLFFLALALSPPMAALPGLFANPALYALVMLAGILAFVVTMTRIGQRLGGKGQLADLLAVTVWLQILRVLAQAALLVAALVSPPIASLLTLAVTAFGLWLFVSFLQVAHGWDGPGNALITAGLSVLALAFGIAILLTLTGIAPPQPI